MATNRLSRTTRPDVRSPMSRGTTGEADPMELLLRQRGFEPYDPIQHAFFGSFPHQAAIQIQGKTWIYDTRKVGPDALADLGVQRGESTIDLGRLAGVQPVNVKDVANNTFDPAQMDSIARLIDIFGRS